MSGGKPSLSDTRFRRAHTESVDAEQGPPRGLLARLRRVVDNAHGGNLRVQMGSDPLLNG